MLRRLLAVGTVMFVGVAMVACDAAELPTQNDSLDRVVALRRQGLLGRHRTFDAPHIHHSVTATDASIPASSTEEWNRILLGEPTTNRRTKLFTHPARRPGRTVRDL